MSETTSAQFQPWYRVSHSRLPMSWPMFGVDRPMNVGRNASTSVHRQASWQYVRTWPSTSSMTMSSRTRQGTMQVQQRCGYT